MMMSLPSVFENRTQAGELLAERLRLEAFSNAVVLGLARGGVVVAKAVAEALHLPLDVMVARKIQSPYQPELAIGAVAPREMILVDERAKRLLQLTDKSFELLAHRAREEMRRRIQKYRACEETLSKLKNATAILVDDGVATGLTARAALRSLRRHPGVNAVVLAVPVGAAETVQVLKKEADGVICLMAPSSLYAVGDWYRDFAPTTDDEVMACLKRDG